MMLNEFHLIRPMWLLALIPLAVLAVRAFSKKTYASAWHEVCDPHLLPYLLDIKPPMKRALPWLSLLLSAFFMVLSLTGPSWSKLPVPIYQAIQPRILILDMSDAMLQSDIKPNRLSRAKFKLHDLLATPKADGQFGLIVYTGEPFVASPLTEDSQTIDALLPMLLPDTMPVTGHRLDSALKEADKLLKQAGFSHGDILVMTANTPSMADIETAKALSQDGVHSAIMPILDQQQALNPLFERFAVAGKGVLVSMTDTQDDLNHWLQTTRKPQSFSEDSHNEVPVWRDEGRWFILPALIFFLPVFRRGWLQKVSL